MFNLSENFERNIQTSFIIHPKNVVSFSSISCSQKILKSLLCFITKICATTKFSISTFKKILWFYSTLHQMEASMTIKFWSYVFSLVMESWMPCPIWLSKSSSNTNYYMTSFSHYSNAHYYTCFYKTMPTIIVTMWNFKIL